MSSEKSDLSQECGASSAGIQVVFKWTCSIHGRDQVHWETKEKGELMRPQLGSGRGYGEI